MIHLFRKAAR